jgi:TRAP-type C4-dicarboxylate transport system substrate-binding protein
VQRTAHVATALLISIAFVTGCGSSSSERVGQKADAPRRVLTMLDPIGNPGVMTPFTDEVARLSGGALRVRVLKAGHGGRTDYEAATIRDVQNGRGDLSFAGARAWDEFGPRSMRALTAPLLIDSYQLEQRVLQSDLASTMLRDLRPLGLVGIGIVPGPLRYPFAASRRLVAPEDYRGLQIGTQQSGVADSTMRALGARPIRLSADIRSLAGLDGLELQLSSVEAGRLDVRGSHVTSNVQLWPRPFVIFAGQRAYERLSPSQRDVLSRALEDALPKMAQVASEGEAEATGNLCRKGNVTFDVATAAQLRALRQAVEPVYADLERDPPTRTAIAAIGQLKVRLAQRATPLPRCANGTGKPAAAATGLDGVWRMDTDRSAARPDYLDENWGHWIFVFERGNFAITQENRRSCTWGYGTYSVKGDRTAWRFTDGGGVAPNNAMNRPGEFFVFRLSRYRDTMTLSAVRGRISPLPFRDKPWRRVAAAPTPQFLSTRCPPPAEALAR